MSHLTSGARRGRPVDAVRHRSIVVWGAPDSGKSGFIGALRSEVTKTVGDRWSLDLRDASPDVTAYADSASLALRLRGVKETPIRRPERAFTVPVRRFAGRKATDIVDLTMLDPRGDLAGDPTSAASRQVLAAARTADAVLWLLETPLPDGNGIGIAQIPLLRQLVAMLEAAGATELAVPVVVALTKIDRLPAAEMQRMLNAPEQALRMLLGDAAFGWLIAAFPRLHCVAISAAGTVRNAVRPVGLTSAIDHFANEWRRDEEEADAAQTRARRSARVARVRHRAPIAAMGAAAAAIIAFAGVAAARLLQQRGETWSSAAGTLASRADSAAPSDSVVRSPDSSGTTTALAAAVARFDSGNVTSALQALAALHVPDTSSTRYAADSLIAIAAIREMEKTLSAPVPAPDALQLVVNSTSAAIARAHPGTAVLAPLSLARAAACIGGHLNCAPDQVREDLAWAIILGTPEEQDRARRLRAALIGDTLVTK